MIRFNARASSESVIMMREFCWHLMSKFC
jgi:hypothetical protein